MGFCSGTPVQVHCGLKRARIDTKIQESALTDLPVRQKRNIKPLTDVYVLFPARSRSAAWH